MPLTETELVQRFRRMGVQPGMALEVHCALSQFGLVQDGADALIRALIQAVGREGSLVMPAFRLSPELALTEDDRKLGLIRKIRILSADAPLSGMGIVADTFRKRRDVITGEGVFRVSAWGQDAERHAEGFQYLIDHGGYALLLGVDIYRLSAMHYVEDALPEEIRRRFRPSDEARAIYPEDTWLTEVWEPEAKPWYKIQNEALAKGLITTAHIGSAPCMFFQVRPVIELYRAALLRDPFSLYGLK